MIGSPSHAEAQVGPVIDDKAYRKILDYIEIGKSEGKLVLGGFPGDPEGYFIQPTIFADVDSTARISQEEIFGPVVAFTKATSFDEAIHSPTIPTTG